MIENPWIIGLITGIISAIIGGLIFRRAAPRRTYQGDAWAEPVKHKKGISGFSGSVIFLTFWVILSPFFSNFLGFELGPGVLNMGVIFLVTLFSSMISPGRVWVAFVCVLSLHFLNFVISSNVSSDEWFRDGTNILIMVGNIPVVVTASWARIFEKHTR